MFTELEIREKVIQFVRSHLSLSPGAALEEDCELVKDYHMDELDMIELALAIEEDLGIEFSDDALEDVRTTNDLVKLTIETVEEQL